MLMPTYNPVGGGGGGSDFPVYLNAASLTGSLNRPGTVMTSSAVTATWVGAVGATTVEWEIVSGDPEILPTFGDRATTRFTTELDLIPSGRTAYYRAKITDSLGQIGYSDNLPVYLFNYLS